MLRIVTSEDNITPDGGFTSMQLNTTVKWTAQLMYNHYCLRVLGWLQEGSQNNKSISHRPFQDIKVTHGITPFLCTTHHCITDRDSQSACLHVRHDRKSLCGGLCIKCGESCTLCSTHTTTTTLALCKSPTHTSEKNGGITMICRIDRGRSAWMWGSSGLNATNKQVHYLLKR